jgi:hypothetical protein
MFYYGILFLSITLSIIRLIAPFKQEPQWNHAIEGQAIDRLHRLGQTKPVTVYHFITNDTVEQNIQKVSDVSPDGIQMNRQVIIHSQ